MEHPDYVLVNRRAWTLANSRYTDRQADSAWAEPALNWGMWTNPETEVRALPEIAEKDVIEFGCGTAYLGAKLKRAGARRVVGVDITPAQLATARRLDAIHGLGLELVEANAEAVPLSDESFDLAVSEYGASIWCDPYKWIPEAHRVLRSGGELVFLANSVLSMLCSPDTGPVATELMRAQRSLYRLDWHDDDPGTEFHLGHGEMFALLRETGFEVTGLIELFASDDDRDHPYYDFITAEWARRWPAEEIWRARKL